MKNKYQRLSKEEKKQARLDYRDSNEINGNIYKKLNRLTIISSIGIVYSILSFIIDFFLTKIVWDFVIDAVLLIFCLIFIIKSQSLLSEQVNKFLTNRENNNKKDNKDSKDNKNNKKNKNNNKKNNKDNKDNIDNKDSKDNKNKNSKKNKNNKK